MVARKFIRVYGIRRTMLEIERLAPHADVFIGCAPRTSYTSGTLDDIERVWCLWVDCDTPEASARLRRFRPRPSLVIASGGPDRHHAYWPLNCPLSTAGADRANRRLAKALGADNVCDATRVLRPVGSDQPQARREPSNASAWSRPCSTRQTSSADSRTTSDTHPVAATQRAGDTAGGTDGLVKAVADAEDGNRNNTLYWAACRAAEEGTLDQSATSSKTPRSTPASSRPMCSPRSAAPRGGPHETDRGRRRGDLRPQRHRTAAGCSTSTASTLSS